MPRPSRSVAAVYRQRKPFSEKFHLRGLPRNAVLPCGISADAWAPAQRGTLTPRRRGRFAVRNSAAQRERRHMPELFNGCYYKLQSPNQTIAFIPALHRSGGQQTCSLQIITESGAFCLPFPAQDFVRRPGRPDIRIGRNVFCSRQIRIHLHTSLLQIEGHVRFGPLTPLRYDIMGPFRFVPGMECRHSVYSMTHAVRGRLTVNGTEYRFDDGLGYIEGDRGRSFPRRYLWTQCHFGSDALMLSAADIPVGPLQFTGIIGVVFLRGREYRLATYLGARITRLGDGAVEVRQGKYTLTARLIEKTTHPLYAPSGGAMNRIIRESAACCAAYRFSRDSTVLLEGESRCAAFEYEYPD